MYSKKVLNLLKEDGIKPGDEIKLVTNEEEVTGLLLDRPDYLEEDTLIIKLGNGYNTGINLERVESVELVEKRGKSETGREKKHEGDLEELGDSFISILHTGGTIASRVDYRTGGVVSNFDPEELLKMFPELREYGRVRSVFLGNMLSDDMRFAHYKLMAEQVKKEVELGSDGVIITHGTDTMGYTAAGLSFIFKNLPIPVLLVGAQRSSDRPSSDAGMNLICAVKFIKETSFKGVGVCMHAGYDDDNCVILPGVNTRKLHTSKRSAFEPVNKKVIAEVEYAGDDITFYTKHERGDGEFEVHPGLESKVGILRVKPNMYADEVKYYRENDYKGLVIEGTGLGHAPISEIDEYTKEHSRIKEEIRKLIKSGCVVVMTSQTIHGRVNMNVYSPGRDLLNMGVIPAGTMTTETAYVKLAWLLKNRTERVTELMQENLRGELVKRLTV